LIRQDRNPFHDTAIGGKANVFGNHCDGFFLSVRKNGAKPTDAARQRERGPETAH
jgi:hypothetical protein